MDSGDFRSPAISRTITGAQSMTPLRTRQCRCQTARANVLLGGMNSLHVLTVPSDSCSRQSRRMSPVYGIGAKKVHPMLQQEAKQILMRSGAVPRKMVRQKM